jgi:hypothetical protein
MRTLVLWEGKCFRKELKMGSENSEIEAMVCASERERTRICQSRPGSTERSVNFIKVTDCVINRKINN